MKILFYFLFVFLFAVMFSSCITSSQKPKWHPLNVQHKFDPIIEIKIKDLLLKMTLEEKVGQMIQAEIQKITPEELKKYKLGSILNGGGSFPSNSKLSKVSDWVKLADKFYNASISTDSKAKIPVIWGTDAVHGHNNVFGATIFPHNIGLGATNNVDLIKQIANITALEVSATGIDWVFAPTVAVARDKRWGRTYESYSESPAIVKNLAGAYVKGLQGEDSLFLDQDHLVATVKHFIGDGGTFNGVDQGDSIVSEADLIDIHAQGYYSALNSGAQTVMASFSSWNGEKIHGNKYLLTEILKNQMMFDGFVIGDWNGHGQVKGCTNDSCAQAINAGVDMIMVPDDWKKFYLNTIKQVQNGEISLERINDAVIRILRVKMRAGLFNFIPPSKRKNAGNQSLIGKKDHRALARQAVSESLVLLKNKNNILPIDPKLKILVTGAGANNISQQSGGWTLTWQGTKNTNTDFPNGTSIYDGIKNSFKDSTGSVHLSPNGEYKKRPDVAIVVFGETPYAEGQGDIQNLFYKSIYTNDLETLNKLKKQGIATVSIFLTGRPLWVNSEINASDSFVVAWLPGTEGQGVADVIIKKNNGEINKNFSGRLAFSWPNYVNLLDSKNASTNNLSAYPVGYGLKYGEKDNSAPLSEVIFQFGNKSKGENTISIFSGRAIKPFKSYVTDFKHKKHELEGSVGLSPSGSVKVTAIDKDLQEDARQVQFDGKESFTYFFQANLPLNLESYLASNGTLNFEFLKGSTKFKNIFFGLGESSFKIDRYLKELENNKWSTIIIPIRCFNDSNINLRNINIPFMISSSSPLDFSIANISISTNTKAVGDCSFLK